MPPAPGQIQSQLAQLFATVPELEFAILIGSRAQGTAAATSDWDIALQWCPQADWLALIGTQENLRRRIADILGVSSEDIDLIDLSRLNLTMRASVAEDGIVLKGEDSLAWARFLTRTWRELEDHYWERAHAASPIPSRNRPHCHRVVGSTGYCGTTPCARTSADPA